MLFVVSHRFLSIRIMTSPMTMIAAIDIAPSVSTYVSVIVSGAGVGVEVACGASLA